MAQYGTTPNIAPGYLTELARQRAQTQRQREQIKAASSARPSFWERVGETVLGGLAESAIGLGASRIAQEFPLAQAEIAKKKVETESAAFKLDELQKKKALLDATQDAILRIQDNDAKMQELYKERTEAARNLQMSNRLSADLARMEIGEGFDLSQVEYGQPQGQMDTAGPTLLDQGLRLDEEFAPPSVAQDAGPRILDRDLLTITPGPRPAPTPRKGKAPAKTRSFAHALKMAKNTWQDDVEGAVGFAMEMREHAKTPKQKLRAVRAIAKLSKLMHERNDKRIVPAMALHLKTRQILWEEGQTLLEKSAMDNKAIRKDQDESTKLLREYFDEEEVMDVTTLAAAKSIDELYAMASGKAPAGPLVGQADRGRLQVFERPGMLLDQEQEGAGQAEPFISKLRDVSAQEASIQEGMKLLESIEAGQTEGTSKEKGITKKEKRLRRLAEMAARQELQKQAREQRKAYIGDMKKLVDVTKTIIDAQPEEILITSSGKGGRTKKVTKAKVYEFVTKNLQKELAKARPDINNLIQYNNEAVRKAAEFERRRANRSGGKRPPKFDRESAKKFYNANIQAMKHVENELGLKPSEVVALLANPRGHIVGEFTLSNVLDSLDRVAPEVGRRLNNAKGTTGRLDQQFGHRKDILTEQENSRLRELQAKSQLSAWEMVEKAKLELKVTTLKAELKAGGKTTTVEKGPFGTTTKTATKENSVLAKIVGNIGNYLSNLASDGTPPPTVSKPRKRTVVNGKLSWKQKRAKLQNKIRSSEKIFNEYKALEADVGTRKAVIRMYKKYF
tara:strand:- start:1078 stop:3450 length:2373 start_codon:yes stop_codon:yes gene_type:complete